MLVKRQALLYGQWLNIKSSKAILGFTDKPVKTTVCSRKGANQYYWVTVILWFFKVAFHVSVLPKGQCPTVFLPSGSSSPKRGSHEGENVTVKYWKAVSKFFSNVVKIPHSFTRYLMCLQWVSAIFLASNLLKYLTSQTLLMLASSLLTSLPCCKQNNSCNNFLSTYQRGALIWSQGNKDGVFRIELLKWSY